MNAWALYIQNLLNLGPRERPLASETLHLREHDGRPFPALPAGVTAAGRGPCTAAASCHPFWSLPACSLPRHKPVRGPGRRERSSKSSYRSRNAACGHWFGGSKFKSHLCQFLAARLNVNCDASLPLTSFLMYF